MRVVFFCHTLRSDWNHGNAHFLRGIVSDLVWRGKHVSVYEPEDSWSCQNLRAEYGEGALEQWRDRYPLAKTNLYREEELDLDTVLAGADLVIVHEWNSHSLVARIGEHRASAAGAGYRLLFHDTHHRSVTEPEAMRAYDLRHYDGVLAFGQVIRDIYLREGWARRAWTWHEAADTRVFHPVVTSGEQEGDLVWIGNWGDGERAAELREFLIDPVRELGLKAAVYGVRYPDEAKRALADAGIEYRGWLPNYQAPEVFARYKFTVHVPRGPYVKALPGVPTIRVFEALACGIPLISAPWEDSERLFSPGCEFLTARDGGEMRRLMQDVLDRPQLRSDLALAGLDAIQTRHSCAHRVDELWNIYNELCTS